MEDLSGNVRPKVMTRYGKIVFSENAALAMGLIEDACVKLGTDDDFSNFYLTLSSKNRSGSIQVKKTGIYHYISCADLLKFFGLYSHLPVIYELVKEFESNGNMVYRLSKLILPKDTPFNEVIKDKNEARSILAMINAKI